MVWNSWRFSHKKISKSDDPNLRLNVRRKVGARDKTKLWDPSSSPLLGSNSWPSCQLSSWIPLFAWPGQCISQYSQTPHVVGPCSPTILTGEPGAHPRPTGWIWHLLRPISLFFWLRFPQKTSVMCMNIFGAPFSRPTRDKSWRMGLKATKQPLAAPAQQRCGQQPPSFVGLL